MPANPCRVSHGIAGVTGAKMPKPRLHLPVALAFHTRAQRIPNFQSGSQALSDREALAYRYDNSKQCKRYVQR